MIKTVKELKEFLEGFSDDCNVMVGDSEKKGAEVGWSCGRGDCSDEKKDAIYVHFNEPGSSERVK